MLQIKYHVLENGNRICTITTQRNPRLTGHERHAMLIPIIAGIISGFIGAWIAYIFYND